MSMDQPPLTPPADRAAAAKALLLPSIGLMLAGGLSMAIGIFRFFLTAEAMTDMYAKFFPPEQAKQMGEMASKMGAMFGVGSVLVGAFVIFGAIQMKGVRSWGLALATTIVAGLNVCDCCCVVGLPFSIWALIVLLRPEIKAAFEQSAA